MKTLLLSLFLTPFFISMMTSCTSVSYNHIKSASPTWDFWLGQPWINTLQPTLSWQPLNSVEKKFDIIIYKDMWISENDLLRPQRGEMVYYREGIECCNHQIEQPLEIKKCYFWSVRTRNGTNVGPWATINKDTTIINSNSYEFNSWFSFCITKVEK